MKLTNSYAFSAENNVGKLQSKIQTPLLESKTIKGDPVVALCQNDSFIAQKNGSALVSKDKEGHWQPVATIEDLKKIVSGTSQAKLGQELGIWTDSRHLLIKAKDGIPQNREVKPLQTHWDECAVNSTVEYDDLGIRNQDPSAPPQQMAVGWSFSDATVRAREVSVTPANFPGKQVAVLEEPLYISSQEILRVTDFSDQGYYTPTAVESILHKEGKASKTTPNANYDLAPLIFGEVPIEYVIPSKA